MHPVRVCSSLELCKGLVSLPSLLLLLYIRPKLRSHLYRAHKTLVVASGILNVTIVAKVVRTVHLIIAVANSDFVFRIVAFQQILRHIITSVLILTRVARKCCFLKLDLSGRLLFDLRVYKVNY